MILPALYARDSPIRPQLYPQPPKKSGHTLKSNNSLRDSSCARAQNVPGERWITDSGHFGQKGAISHRGNGARDDKAGALGSVYDIGRDGRLNHRVEAHGGLLARECGEILSQFFAMRRLKTR